MDLKIAAQRRHSKRPSAPTIRTAASTRTRTPADHLQNAIGNSAMTRLLATNQVQAKLSISHPADASEREADRVAAEVMRMPEPQPGSTVQRSPVSIQRSCDKCEEESKRKPILDKDDEEVQAKFVDTAAGSGATGGLESYLSTSQGRGQQLPPLSRAYFEPRLGRDLSDVRIHADSRASQAANSIAAKAFTTGKNIVFGAGQYAPESAAGRTLLAHELTHVMQQSVDQTDAGSSLSGSRSVRFGTLQRTPAAPRSGAQKVLSDRSKIDVNAISDVLLDTDLNVFRAMTTTASVSFNDAAITSYSSTLYDAADVVLTSSLASNPVPGSRQAGFLLFENLTTTLKQGRHILRCVGYDAGGQPVAYADRSFYVWTSTPTGKPPDIAALEAEKTSLEAITKVGSGKTFNEVAIAFTKLLGVNQRLGVLTTGTGPYVGSNCPIQPAGAAVLGCTNSVKNVLRNVLTQQGRAADWARLDKKIDKNVLSHSKKVTDIEGGDIQAALQSELGWKGIFWAPDPSYKVPDAELVGGGITGDTAGWALRGAKKKGIYKDRGKPGVSSITHFVTDYAPEAPKPGHGDASKTKTDTTQLDKLKKLPFGVLSAHGATHMAFIIYGKVVEIHWREEATSVNLIEQTDLEKWAVGPESGYHYYASGAIVAPAADVDAAFK